MLPGDTRLHTCSYASIPNGSSPDTGTNGRRWSYGRAYCSALTYSHSLTNGSAGPDSDSSALAYSYPFAVTYSRSFTNGNAGGPNPDSRADIRAHRGPNTDARANGHAQADGYRYANPDFNPITHSNSNSKAAAANGLRGRHRRQCHLHAVLRTRV